MDKTKALAIAEMLQRIEEEMSLIAMELLGEAGLPGAVKKLLENFESYKKEEQRKQRYEAIRMSKLMLKRMP